MTKRITQSLVVAIGLVALACGGADRDRAQRADTAGMEAPPAEIPQGRAATEADMQNREARVAIPEGAQPGMTPGEPGMQPGTAEPMRAITDAEVSSFVDALVQLAMLEQQGMARIQAGEPQEQVQASLQPQVDVIFAGAELTPKRFSDIAEQADRDPALAQRIEMQLEQRLAAAPPA